MRKKTRSILHELNSMIVEKDRQHVLESLSNKCNRKCNQSSTKCISTTTKQSFGDLERRLLNSINIKIKQSLYVVLEK